MENGVPTRPVDDSTELEQIGEVLVGDGAKREALLIGLGLSRLNSRQKHALNEAKQYALDQSVRHVAKQQQISFQEKQQKSHQLSQALSLMARLYVGSVSLDLHEEDIRKMFSVFGPIKSLNMSYEQSTGAHKGFAFLEFEVPEAALLAKDAMNGKLYGGRNLKVGRPSNMPAAQPVIEMVTQEAKQYHRIYIASIHPDLSEIDVSTVFGAFGNITRVQLARQHSGKGHRGFGYLEFDSEHAVKEAIDGMNGFDLGGQYLQVGRCITPPDALLYSSSQSSSQSLLPSSSATAAAAITAKIQAQEILNKSKNKGPARPLPLPAPPKRLPARTSASSPKDVLALPPPKLMTPIKKETGSSTSPKVAIPPPKVVIPPPTVIVPQKIKTESGFVPIKNEPSDSFSSISSIVPPPPPEEKKKKPLPEKRDLISRIKLKPRHDPMQKAVFGTIASESAPRDKTFEEDFGTNDDKLAITGPSNSMALALRNISQLEKFNKDKDKKPPTAEKSKSLSLAATGLKRKRKVKLPKDRRPKLNSAGAMSAVYKAGAINDQMQAAKQLDEEATLDSQEDLKIRGNDARHMLMHKLMRTNRSTIMVLKNMIDASGIDDELEDEIRDECSKSGTVTDLVIVKEKDSEEVRIFVRFADPTQAESAVSVFDGRFFDGRTVVASIYDQILFEHGDYTSV